LQGDLEAELTALAQALFDLGTTVINDLTKEKDLPHGKPVGMRVLVVNCSSPPLIQRCIHRNEIISRLDTLDAMAQRVPTMIPMQTLSDIDNARNPMQLTRERLERTATENQFMNGKIASIAV
jgi:mediator of RNA polymerase II transcription subunit 10